MLVRPPTNPRSASVFDRGVCTRCGAPVHALAPSDPLAPAAGTRWEIARCLGCKVVWMRRVLDN